MAQDTSAAPGILASYEPGHSMLVKNTFLNFIEDQDEDPWMVDPTSCRRQKTDSIMYKASLSRRASDPKPESTFTTARVEERSRAGQLPQKSSENDAALFEGMTGAAEAEFHAPDAAAGAGDGCQDSPIVPVPGGMGMNTTIMIRNVPSKYTQAKLMQEINGAGFLGRFDFLYLPVDPRSKTNRGFAFCNFHGSEMAELFYQAYHGKKLRRFASDQVVEVLPADIQGFEKNAEKYALARANGRIRSSHSRPLFLRPLPAHLATQECFQTETGPKGRKNLETVRRMEIGAPQYVGSSHKTVLPGPARIVAGMKVHAAGMSKSDSPATRAPAHGPAFDGVMRFCPYCGQPKQADFSFCPYCGRQVP